MDKNTAIRLVQNIFQNPFDREQYIAFCKNLFNYLDTEKNFVYQGNLIPDAYDPYIRTFERIGKYEDKEGNKIDVLIVRLKKESSLEHARTMQRNFIAWYLGGSRGDVLKDAALVAFYTDDIDDWRFSLVKMDYQIVESPTGKIKTKTELTPVRRFSFLVGKNENSHTAQKQLLPILQDDKNNPLFSDFEKAFNIEVVTQEFFEKYKSLFLDVKDSLDRLIKRDQAIAKDFVDKSVDPVDFSKKLLGQIVFLYFLQKKGWFGVGRDNDWGTGPKNFLRLLFEKMIADYKNFFNDILEPLFYEALAKERDKDFYSRFNCKIPFLNGGLFDPISDYDWVHTDILLPDELFSNRVRTKEGDIGIGILDIFDRYNFTVKEDEPLEKEVAVDPEMLGKVFENLLEVKDRKSKGTYYTPREIVHYMCQESLINYLVNELSPSVIARSEATKQSLPTRKDIETLIQYGESAVEHDSRVVQEGKETETYSYKLPESIRKNAKLLDDKLKNIRVCDPAIGSGAFPVGMMNEIVRTRNTLTSYLSLRGAEATKQSQSTYNFKRHAIQNSLYGVDIDPGAVEIAKLRLWLSLVVDEEDIKQIKPLPNLDYKIVCGNSLLSVDRQNLFVDSNLKQIEKLKDELFNETNIRKKQEYKEQIDKLIAEVTDNNKAFDFEIYFSEVFEDKQVKDKGFHIIIANPPYREFDEIRLKDHNFLFYRDNYLMKYKFNLYSLFLKKGPQLLRSGGILSYIVPNSFSKEKYNYDIREDYLKNKKVLYFVDFTKEKKAIFDNASNDSYIVFGIQSSKEMNDSIIIYDYLDGMFLLAHFISQRDMLNNFDYQFILSPGNKNIVEKLEKNSVTLGTICMIRVGFTPSKPYKKRYGNDYENFRKKYTGNSNLFPFLRRNNNSDSCNRYLIKHNTDYIIWDKKELYKDRVSPGEFEDYINEKLIFRNRGISLEGSIDNNSLFVNDIFNVIILKSAYKKDRLSKFRYEDITLSSNFFLKYILALINSKVTEFYLKEKFVYRDIKAPMMKKFPIRNISPEGQKPFIVLADKILALTNSSDYLSNTEKQARVKDYEKQIDQLVYKLYGLTPEEISVVEET